MLDGDGEYDKSVLSVLFGLSVLYIICLPIVPKFPRWFEMIILPLR